ncbi:MAG: hypothetical protein B7X44_09730 [Halothiobacillus sp. 15-55-196]|jgi:hypothetical protein|uniref:hypothetical protein n=1 Tax=Halothiobacillus sp. 15-55-196 TaxID=1970382 RepID=UPI000BCC9222|nr:hypothetical protein [Halothiobacillus sp. 15-55-196]OZB35494.1 MAG: hypothetical protein B7X44_09730 [Halothiobacillus sp. 15-55-196]
MFQASQRKNSANTLRVTALALTLAGGSFALFGCSSPKSEMADAINKYLVNKPLTETVTASVQLPQIETGQINFSNNGELGLVLPDIKNSPAAKALADLADAKMIESHSVAVYPKKNPNPYLKQGPVYIAATDHADNTAMLKQINAAEPGAVWLNLSQDTNGFGRQGYVAQASTLEPSKIGKSDPAFLTAVQKNQSSGHNAKLLAKLASAGYLRVEEKTVYLQWGDPLIGKWTGDPNKVRYTAKVDALLYFVTDKGKGLLAMRPLYAGEVPAVKLANSKVTKIISVNSPGKNFMGQTITTVNFEQTQTSTGVNKAAGLELASQTADGAVFSQVTLIDGKFQDYKPSNLLSNTPLQAVSYSVPAKGLITPSYGTGAMSVALGEWKLKSVDNFSKDKNPMFGGQVAQCTFEFEYNPIIKPLIKQLSALGATEKDLPKPGATKPYDCVVNAMDKGYSVMGCMPAPKSGGF